MDRCERVTYNDIINMVNTCIHLKILNMYTYFSKNEHRIALRKSLSLTYPYVTFNKELTPQGRGYRVHGTFPTD